MAKVASQTIKGAGSGAAIGTMIMPGVGTAIGGVIGGALGLFGGLSAQKAEDKAKADFEEQQAIRNAEAERSAMQQQLSVNKQRDIERKENLEAQFAVQLNALEQEAAAKFTASQAGVSGNLSENVVYRIKANEATALNKIKDNYKTQMSNLKLSEEQIDAQLRSRTDLRQFNTIDENLWDVAGAGLDAYMTFKSFNK